MWNIKVRDAQKDIQRAFNIWKGSLNYDKLKKFRLKRMIYKAYTNKLARAFGRWMNFSQTVDQQVRLHVLAKSFTEN